MKQQQLTPPRTLDLHIELAHQLSLDEIAAWRQSMQEFLQRRGLAAVFSVTRVLVLGGRRRLTHADQGALLGWLAAQPWVVAVRIPTRGPAQLQERRAA